MRFIFNASIAFFGLIVSLQLHCIEHFGVINKSPHLIPIANARNLLQYTIAQNIVVYLDSNNSEWKEPNLGINIATLDFDDASDFSDLIAAIARLDSKEVKIILKRKGGVNNEEYKVASSVIGKVSPESSDRTMELRFLNDISWLYVKSSLVLATIFLIMQRILSHLRNRFEGLRLVRDDQEILPGATFYEEFVNKVTPKFVVAVCAFIIAVSATLFIVTNTKELDRTPDNKQEIEALLIEHRIPFNVTPDFNDLLNAIGRLDSKEVKKILKKKKGINSEEYRIASSRIGQMGFDSSDEPMKLRFLNHVSWLTIKVTTASAATFLIMHKIFSFLSKKYEGFHLEQYEAFLRGGGDGQNYPRAITVYPSEFVNKVATRLVIPVSAFILAIATILIAGSDTKDHDSKLDEKQEIEVLLIEHRT